MKKIWTLLVMLLVFVNTGLVAKVRLLTFCYNKPQFIEWQYKMLKEYFLDDFELIVFNDAVSAELTQAIESTCQQLGIQCVRFEQHWHQTHALNNYLKGHLDSGRVYSHLQFKPPRTLASISEQPSVRHCHVIQYALEQYGYMHDDIVAIMDADAFFIRPFSVRKELSSTDIVGIQRSVQENNIEYLWVVFAAFDPQKLPNLYDLRFHVDVIDDVLHDSGAHTYHYIKNNPDVRVKKCVGQTSTEMYRWERADIRKMGYTKQEAWLIQNLPWPQSVEFHMGKALLHFGASSFELEGSEMKEQYVQRFLEKLLIHRK